MPAESLIEVGLLVLGALAFVVGVVLGIKVSRTTPKEKTPEAPSVSTDQLSVAGKGFFRRVQADKAKYEQVSASKTDDMESLLKQEEDLRRDLGL